MEALKHKGNRFDAFGLSNIHFMFRSEELEGGGKKEKQFFGTP